MEKVKLTREQAEAVKWAVADYGSNVIIDSHRPGNWRGNLKPLNELSPSVFSRAVLIGYEVEEEFKVGDWVHDRNTKVTFRISAQQLANILKDERHLSIRFATPEEIKAEQERRVWKKIGRKPGEFHFQDMVTFLDNENYIVTDDTNTRAGVVSKKYAYEAYKGGSLNGFFPRESFISFGGGEE